MVTYATQPYSLSLCPLATLEGATRQSAAAVAAVARPAPRDKACTCHPAVLVLLPDPDVPELLSDPDIFMLLPDPGISME